MKILITGGFGYLGGRLAQYLSSIQKSEIFLSSRTAEQSPFWLPSAQVLKTNWQSKEDLEKICVGVDSVVHLAGLNAQDCSVNFVNALEVNGLLTARLLQAAIKQGVKRFIYLSTAHVYNNYLVGTITEKTPTESTHPYATSHRAGEDVVLAAHKRGNIEGIVIRLSNAFGAPSHKKANCWMLLVNDLCQQAITNQRLVLKTTGRQWRNFITLTDTCRAIEHVLKISVAKLDNGLFNVGGMKSITILDMANNISERVCNITGNRPGIVCATEQAIEQKTILDYKIDKLIGTDFTLNNNISLEIDQLIQFLIEDMSICS